MGLFSFFKKEKQDLSKKYLSIGDKRYDEDDILKMKNVYEVFKKYQNYDYSINLSDGEIVRKKISDLMIELFELKVLCRNYGEFNLYNGFKDITLDDIKKLSILECLVFLTNIQKNDYWSGVHNNIYLGYTKNGFIPQIINRVISLYESRVNN